MNNFEGWDKGAIEALKVRGITDNDRRLLKRANESLKPSNKPPTTPEHNIQKQVIQWFAWKYLEVYITGALFAVPNAGKRGKVAAGRMKAEGMWAGVSDLILMLPKGQYHALCVEMKTTDGRLSREQDKWLFNRRLSGYATEVCYTFEQAKEAITAYMEL